MPEDGRTKTAHTPHNIICAHVIVPSVHGHHTNHKSLRRPKTDSGVIPQHREFRENDDYNNNAIYIYILYRYSVRIYRENSL